MPPTIQLLPDDLINKIAAGEVVERPASVVKELVENSLDAGAAEITVDLKGGGRQRIRVIDDGRGMSREDALMALQRHATSKIRTGEDLFGIHTLGFRGEALAAIGGVSRLELRTRLADQPVGTRVRSVGGAVEAVEEVGCPVGTDLTIDDLFFNTPARLKFLRSATVEGGHVADVLTRLALARDGVGFQLTRGRETLLRVSHHAQGLERIHGLLGARVAEQLFPVGGERLGCSLRGFASSPGLSRSGWTGFYLFVNGRSLRDRKIMRAVAEAYGGVLPRGRYPVVVLHLDVPPREVDVNVHPGKLEVRFARERLVSELVVDTLRRALARAPWRKGKAGAYALSHPLEGGGVAGGSLEAGGEERTWSLVREGEPPAKLKPGDGGASMPGDLPIQRWLRGERPGVETGGGSIPQGEGGGPGEGPGAGGGSGGAHPRGEGRGGGGPAGEATRPGPEGQGPAGVGPGEAPHPPSAAPDAGASQAGPAPAGADAGEAAGEAGAAPRTFSKMRVIGQYAAAWILCQDEGELVLVDQHAAAERVARDALLAAQGSGGRGSQPLLMPRIVELGPREAAALGLWLEELSQLGVEIEPFGGGSFAVKAVPRALSAEEPDALVRDLARELGPELAKADAKTRRERILATLISHGSVGAIRPLKQAEMKALLAALDGADPQDTCPHGRPLTARLSRREVERLFRGR